VFEPPPADVERRPINLASRVLQAGAVALVTSRHKGQENVLPVAWHTPLASIPALLGIVVEQSRYSAELISHAEEFAINIPSRLLLHHVQYLGSMRGEHVNKLEATQLETFAAAHITAPLIRDCIAWIECEVRQALPLGDHILYIGQPVAVHVRAEAFGDRWRPEAPAELQPLLFLGGNAYTTFGDLLLARVPRDFEAPERVLAERATEELELSREAHERREEQLQALRREVQAGNVVDLSAFSLEAGTVVDLTGGVVLDEQPGASGRWPRGPHQPAG